MMAWIYFCLLSFVATGQALRCYKCDNSESQACGQDFQAYQFKAIMCSDQWPHKCGKQLQEPNPDGWVGVIRGCYPLGSLPGLNETNGCHSWYNPDLNFSALYCFCDRDYCNSACPTTPLLLPRFLWALALLITFCLSSSSSSLVTVLTPSPTSCLQTRGTQAPDSGVTRPAEGREGGRGAVFPRVWKTKGVGYGQANSYHRSLADEERQASGETVGVRQRHRPHRLGGASSPPHRK